MAQHQTKHLRQRIPDGSLENQSYLGENGESFFIRTSGKGDFKVVNLISRSTFALIDAFFTSEEEARLFAHKRKLKIVDYTENACSAPSTERIFQEAFTLSEPGHEKWPPGALCAGRFIKVLVACQCLIPIVVKSPF
jgi:hypothetical protein